MLVALAATAGCLATPATAPSDSALAAGCTPGGPVAITHNQTRYIPGTEYVLTGQGGDCRLHWVLALDVPGKHPQPVRNATGATFNVTFAEPGRFVLTLTDGHGDEATTTMPVDLHLRVKRHCDRLVPTGLEPPTTTCGGVNFTLGPGAFMVAGSASFPANQNAFPCPYLWLLQDGEDAFTNYWWSLEGHTSPASLAQPVLFQGRATMELRWVPTAATGLEDSNVDYAVDVTALGPGGYGGAGGNGC